MVLAIWPLVILVLFASLPASRALIYATLSSYLLLPVATSFDLSGLPSLNKTTIPAFTILLCVAIFGRRKSLRAPKDRLIFLSMIVLVLAPVATALTNKGPLQYADLTINGLTLYDGLAASFAQVAMIIPFVCGYNMLSNERGYRDLLMALAVAGLIYTLPMLVEIRLSPQLHRWVYGFHPQSFGQQIRDGGYRPVVFLGHGLLVATFCCMSLISAIALWRLRTRVFRLNPGLWAFYLAVILILCKTLGSLAIAIIFAPAMWFLKPRRLAIVCALAGALILVYPALRGGGLVPTATISSLAASVSTDRAGSAQFRFDNEDRLLNRASQKPFFGWGSYGRNRVYDAQGRDISITDGTWIITVGQWGWIGYLATFGLLCLPLLAVLWRSRRSASPAAALLSVVLTVNLIDLIPNSSLSPVTWLIAGALAAAPRLTKRIRTGEHFDDGGELDPTASPQAARVFG